MIFSQYTRMLKIIREDLEKQGMRFEYLDGSSKNRLQIVKQFNEDETISVFLVSLKAGDQALIWWVQILSSIMICGGILPLKIRRQIVYTGWGRKNLFLLIS